LVAEPAGTGVPSCAAAGPFAVCGDQLPQLSEVGGRVVAADWAPRATTAKPVQQSQLDLTPFCAASRDRRDITFDSARAKNALGA
jgi:hypothetical protein